MKIEVTVTDVRDTNAQSPFAAYAYTTHTPKWESYTRTEVTADGSADMVAATLRAIADDLDGARDADRRARETASEGSAA